MPVFFWTAFGLLCVYGLLTKLVNYLTPGQLFCPQKPSYADETADVLKLPLTNGQRISALYLPNPRAKLTLLFSHGNTADIGLCLPLIQSIFAQGFSVLAYDYPGYGTSEGKPSESGLYQAITAAYEFLTLKRHIPAHRIVAYGRSLGGGPTVDLATRFPLAGIILECTFTSVFRVKMHYRCFPGDRFCNLEKAPHIRCPVLMIHGKQDALIPFWHAERLYAAIRTLKRCLWVEQADHHDIEETAPQEFWKTIHDFCEEIYP